MALLTNLAGQSVGAVLTTSQIQIFLSRGSFCDYTVRQGVISGMSNGTPLTGSGGIITPSSFDETTLTGKGPEDYTTQTEIGTPEVFTTVSAAGSDNPGTSDAQSVPAVVLNPESANNPPQSNQSKGVEAVSLNLVRFDGQALKVQHANGDTVLYICVITDAGDVVGKYVS